MSILEKHAASVGSDTLRQQHETNRESIKTQATAAIQTNKDFLALASPTNAQTLAQVKALSRQNIRIIRLILNKLDAVE